MIRSLLASAAAAATMTLASVSSASAEGATTPAANEAVTPSNDNGPSCAGELTSVLVRDVASGFWISDTAAVFDWGLGTGDRQHLQISLLSATVFGGPLETIPGFSVGVCGGTADATYRIFSSFTRGVPSGDVTVTVGGEGIFALSGRIGLDLTGSLSWTNGAFDGVGLDLKLKAPIGRDAPLFILIPNVKLQLSGSGVGLQPGLTVVVPVATNLALIGGASYSFGGGAKLIGGFNLSVGQ